MESSLGLVTVSVSRDLDLTYWKIQVSRGRLDKEILYFIVDEQPCLYCRDSMGAVSSHELRGFQYRRVNKCVLLSR